jgi:aspartate racemase
MVDERLDDLKPLRQLLAGGDVLCPKRVDKARRALPDCRLINGYGPTENTTYTCCYTVADDRELIPTVLIGRPIANTRVYVLDQRLQPVPVGVAGELFAGSGLARGYQPAATDGRTILRIRSVRRGARLYRTGDRVRWRSDGNIEFLGRWTQVKIRGFRVELGDRNSAACPAKSASRWLLFVRPRRP